MDKFGRLVATIQRYENDSCGMKATAHHSAVSVRVAEMEAAMLAVQDANAVSAPDAALVGALSQEAPESGSDQRS